MRTLLYTTLPVLALCAAFGQTAEAPPRFVAADVHPSPLSPIVAARGPFMTGSRYDLHNATMVDLIVKAYGVTADKVLDGPNWLEYDRFEVSALVPPKTSANDAKLMLQALLADRFQLAIRKEARPLPSYVLTAPKGKQKLKEADGSGDTGCKMTIDQLRPADISAGVAPAPTISYTCRNMTMAAFTEGLPTMQFAQQAVGNNPVLDKTDLEGRWDFNFKYSLPIVGATDGVTFPDALDKQVGLKLEQATTPVPVIVVEKASRTPSPNEPDVAKKIPGLPTEFEVATIKPIALPTASSNNAPFRIGVQTQPGGRVQITGLTLKQLMQQAWTLQADSMVGAPKFMETDRYEIVAKVPVEGAAAPNTPIDNDTVNVMVRALLADRFHLKTHFEDRPMAAYTLTAPKPKLKKADPASRTKWLDANAAGGFTLISNGPIPSRTIKFQNMSMAQLAEKLQTVASAYIHAPVLDGTGLEGGYDFTLTFSLIPAAQLANMVIRTPDGAGGANTTADPIGGVSIMEAIEKQLGLKLVEQKRPVPVLVIDHIDEKPSEN